MKNSSDTIGNRTRDLPTCSAGARFTPKFKAFLDDLHKYSPLSVLRRGKHDSAFRCTTSNVESRSTSLSAVSGPMSNHDRQLFPLLQVQCRVTIGSSFRCSRSNFESDRQLFPLFQVHCRVTIDSSFRCTMSNVESRSIALSAVPGPM